MQVNICARIIDKMVRNGEIFVSQNGSVAGYIPRGAFATQKFKTGETVRELSGRLYNNPTRTSIHIGNNMHVEDDLGRYINHSFEPNVKVEINKLIAIKDINIHDEITFNYNETEVNMAYPFEDDGIQVCGKKK